MFQDGVVERALDTGLKVTVEVNEPEEVLAVLTVNIHVPVLHDLAFGQDPGLSLQRISTLPKSSIAECCLARNLRTKSTSSMITCVSSNPNRRIPRPNSVSGGRMARRRAISAKAVSYRYER